MDSEIEQSRQQKITTVMLEPIREVWIHGEAFAASRLSMMRIMARRMNAATVAA
jgi:cob(I)alamin adenosyltransferase